MGTPDNKRKADAAVEPNGDDEQQTAAKRAKLNGGTAADGSKPKPAIDMSVLEKAKKALEMQKGLKEKLARLKEAKAAAAAPVPSSKPSAKMPPPLVLDEHGREVGAAGALPAPTAPIAAVPAAPFRTLPEAEIEEEEDQSHFDPSLGNRGARKLQRRARPALQFVEEGKFQKQAELLRLKAEFGDDYVRELEERRQREREEEAAAGGMNANLVPLGVRPEALAAPEEPVEEIPDVEWWDARILVDKTTYGEDPGSESKIRTDRITHYVEHPVLMQPPLDTAPPPPQPLRLTRRELKKMRTQRRQAREQEKQELIRQGLLEPPKPKVKISNLMRVLGAEAAADPTAIEAEVRRQMAERAAAHEDRNLARMLTPAERRDKKLRKLLDKPPGGGATAADGGENDGSGGGAPAGPVETHVAVYKIGSLSTPQLKFKVEVNAKENHMTGTAIVVPGVFSLVIVEGGPKTLRRYEKLMLRRINWNAGAEEDEEGEESAAAVAAAANYCHLVWTGVVKEPAFKGKFKTEEVRGEAAARRSLDERGVAQYWDLAAAYQIE